MRTLACVGALFACGGVNAQTKNGDTIVKKLIYLSMLIPTFALAQVYVDSSGSLGSMTQYAGTSPFNYVDEFSLPDNSPTYILGSTTLAVFGQNGLGTGSGRAGAGIYNRTTFSQPVLMQATPSTDGSPWTDIAPAVDMGGNPVTFVCTSAIKAPCTAWQYTGDLPVGSYTLHITGTSCGGPSCRIRGGSNLYVSSSPVYTYVPPPPPPPCLTCGGD